MGPQLLARWEGLLRSDVAVALLLLGATLVLGGLLLAWCRELMRDNRELRRELIENLKSDGDLTRVLRDLGEVLELFDRHRSMAARVDQPALPVDPDP